MIDPTFQYRKLNEVGQRKSVEVAEAFTELLEKLRGICLRETSHGGIDPNGREFAIMRTKLEEASFFSKKCVAMLPENQEPPTMDELPIYDVVSGKTIERSQQEVKKGFLESAADAWLEEKQLVADAMKNSGRNEVLR